MLISRKLLNRYVDIEDISTEVLAEALTNAGLEVETVTPLIHGTNLVVGYVESCEAHPESDHLSVCRVDLGDKFEQIVCGAANIAQGQHVIVAQVGAVLPEITIKPTKIRGIESNGMICSLKELGVQEKFINDKDKEGIVVLKNGKAGDNPAVCLGMDDDVIDVSQTPNRSDFLAMHSVAYEVSAIFDRALKLPEFDGAALIGDATQLKINSDTEMCKLFYGKVINGITIKESPAWIKEALMASGIKSINNVVDISNLVMLETGQPLHFYDSEFLKVQDLSVRNDLEIKVTALDEKEYHIQNGDLVIMNDETPVGIAGIMGLGNSMIHDATTGLVIEVASFDMVSVRKTASRLGLSTESSQRFSKPMDPLAPVKAMDRAVALLLEYADATGIEETVSYGEAVYEPVSIQITTKKVNDYLGTTLTEETVFDVFKRLALEPTLDNGIITCTIPSFRNDLRIDVDLIEEVIRIVGYDILGETLPKLDLTMGALDPRQEFIQQIEKIMLGMGGYQTLSYTLVEKAHTENGEGLPNPIKLMSPMSDKRTYLRTQLTPSLIEVASYNNSRRNDNGLYFEISKIYTEDITVEKLIILGQGNLLKQNWNKENVNLDFFAVKGMFFELVDQLGLNQRRFNLLAEDFDKNMFHPYKTASITFDRKRIGVLGHLHPNVLKENDLKDTVILEITLDTLMDSKKTQIKYDTISPYPTVMRDLSILCDPSISAKDLMGTIEKSASRLLKDLNVFDVFQNEKLGDQKSIAIQLTFGADHTLTEDEIQTVMNTVTKSLIDKHNVVIR